MLRKIAALVTCLLFNAASHAMTGQEEEMNYLTRCFGRFCAKLPEDWQPRNAEYEIRYVRVSEEAREPGDDAEGRWQQLLAEKQNLEKEDIADPRGTIVETREFPRNARGVRYHRFHGEAIQTWELLLPLPDRWVIFQADFSDDRKAYTENLLFDVLNAYHATKIDDTGSGFRLAQGRVNLPFLYSENVQVSFASPDGNTSLSFHVRTHTRKKETGLLERLGRRISGPFATSLPEGIASEYQWRTLAGMWGDELRMQEHGEHPKIHFAWHYDGKRKSSRYPIVDIEMEAHGDAASADETSHIWNEILKSFRYTESDN